MNHFPEFLCYVPRKYRQRERIECARARVIGLILMCFRIRFIATGFFEELTKEVIMNAIVDAVQKASER